MIVWAHAKTTRTCQALASCGFDETFQADAFQSVANFTRTGGEGGPWNRIIRIQVDHQSVGSLQRLIATGPGMNFENSNLG